MKKISKNFQSNFSILVGIPAWASYSLFAGITLALGCVLGFFIVCIIDRVFPTAVQPDKKVKKDFKGKGRKVFVLYSQI